MCEYRTLYHDKTEGYIIHCLACDNIQVAFGNLSVTFTRQAFTGFCESIRSLHCEEQSQEDLFHKCITLSTPCEGVKFLLSSSELRKLDQMLDAADSELRSQEMISLFRNR